MMFHVKPNSKTAVNIGPAIILIAICTLFLNCIGARATVQIPDYLIVPNGKENTNGEPLNAFVFENNTRAAYQIEYFLAEKYKTGNYHDQEIWVNVLKDRYKLIVYDNADFEKYFNSANYAQINAEAQNDRNYSERKFIAISMISAYNEDCLKEGSLLQNIAVNYLRDLKNEYLNQ